MKHLAIFKGVGVSSIFKVGYIISKSLEARENKSKIKYPNGNIDYLRDQTILEFFDIQPCKI